MTTSSTEWLNAFAGALGVEPLTDAQCEDILALAGTAAHASERTAAPIACWLAATAGLTTTEARELAARMEQSRTLDDPDAS